MGTFDTEIEAARAYDRKVIYLLFIIYYLLHIIAIPSHLILFSQALDAKKARSALNFFEFDSAGAQVAHSVPYSMLDLRNSNYNINNNVNSNSSISSSNINNSNMGNNISNEEVKLPPPPPIYAAASLPCEPVPYTRPESIKLTPDCYKAGELGALWERLCQVREYTFISICYI